MAIETLELAVFTSVVRLESFAGAAEAHALSASAVSRLIARLEEKLGVRLIQRTTRRLSLTEAGATFHARASRILSDLEEAEAEASASALRPRGTVRISAPVALGRRHLGAAVDDILKAFPELAIDLSLSDRFVDLVDEGFDLAVRTGALPDSRLVVRRLCANRRILVASPDYLRRRGRPAAAADLVRHDCLIFTALSRPREWRLSGPAGAADIAVGGPVSSNNGEFLIDLARRGKGIAFAATFVVHEALKAGDLVRVLPDHELEATSIFAAYPSSRQLSSKVRAVVDHLAQAFRDPPPWDRA